MDNLILMILTMEKLRSIVNKWNLITITFFLITHTGTSDILINMYNLYAILHILHTYFDVPIMV